MDLVGEEVVVVPVHAVHAERALVAEAAGGLKSALARHSDIVLNVRVPKEACPFNLAPTASTTASTSTAASTPPSR